MKTPSSNTTLFFLSCLLLFSCSSNKTDVSNGADKDNATKPVVNANQMLAPCHWTYQVEQNTPDEATLIATAKIDEGWHLYSQQVIDADKGPLPMLFTYNPMPDYKLEGITEEVNPHREHDPFFDTEVFYFEKEAMFKQKIKVSGKKDFTITGTIDYQACLTQCVNSSEDFSFNVKGNPGGK